MTHPHPTHPSPGQAPGNPDALQTIGEQIQRAFNSAARELQPVLALIDDSIRKALPTLRKLHRMELERQIRLSQMRANYRQRTRNRNRKVRK